METRDIGFGTKGKKGSGRMLNPDGTYNVKRINTKFDWYHHLVTCSSIHFIVYVLLFYIVFNAVFALAYNVIGIENLQGVRAQGDISNFWAAFFFSIQTFTTVGYGAVHPVGYSANLLAATEALLGILSISVVSGILFGRFTQKKESILFSKNAVITDLKGQKTFQFRIANSRSAELIELNAKCVFSMFKEENNERKRHYFTLDLERDYLMLFPLNWTLVHPITEKSPLYQLTKEELAEREAEVVILVSGFDDSAKQMIYSKYSYISKDIHLDKKFVPAFSIAESGNTVFNINEIDNIV